MVESSEDPAKILPGTVPVDPRFPNCNVTRYCFVMFADYHRCIRLFNEGHEDCNYFKRAYTTICPNFWIEKFDQQIEDGTFPYNLPKKR